MPLQLHDAFLVAAFAEMSRATFERNVRSNVVVSTTTVITSDSQGILNSSTSCATRQYTNVHSHTAAGVPGVRLPQLPRVSPGKSPRGKRRPLTTNIFEADTWLLRKREELDVRGAKPLVIAGNVEGDDDGGIPPYALEENVPSVPINTPDTKQ
ncbi:uncharacterized protein LOC105278190 [Ooceraea biroi]|uniref:uncharacterized protein LOC105278190 n=1 Tax=Ooceraea biroi TaxID=2015173 RepID=UPI000F096CBF|nr:uncharacterized protein LOC105278190 [Ooceraea biroi]